MRDLTGGGQSHIVVYGLLFEFKEPEPLIQAAQAARHAGIKDMDAFSPYPMEDLPEAIGFEKEGVALWTLIGGIFGGAVAYGMQWYCNVFDYPINVGGRPDYSWPAFIPVTFELTVLGASLFAAFGMLALNKLPSLWHPVFHVPEFLRASRDRFFLCIKARDPHYDAATLQNLMGTFKPLSVREVTFED